MNSYDHQRARNENIQRTWDVVWRPANDLEENDLKDALSFKKEVEECDVFPCMRNRQKM